VLAELSNAVDEWHYGFALSKATGQPSGTLYPILARLHDAGMLESRWEPSQELGRPPRHLYRLTAAGRRYAQESAGLEAARRRAQPSRPRTDLGWQP
jgi:DNA-binding PadR family transcriptional regulator